MRKAKSKFKLFVIVFNYLNSRRKSVGTSMLCTLPYWYRFSLCILKYG